MRNRTPSFLFYRIFLVLLFLSMAFGWMGCSTLPKTLAIDKLPGSVVSEYQFNQEKIPELINKIEAGDFGKIHSLIIIQNDAVINERYFDGWHRHKLHELFSVTKSVTSALIGIAIEQGFIEGVDLKLIDLFPEYNRLENMDPRKNVINLENLLTMTAGYRWNELDVPYKNKNGSWNAENDIVKMHINSQDVTKYVLDLPVVNDPGKKYNYNTGCSILLGEIIRRKTGKSAEEYAAEHLFKPLGIRRWKWKKSSDGTTDTGGGLYLYPVDMAMFGYLFLNNGKVNGKQIISEDWIARSTKGYVFTKTGEYGYQWWRFKRNSGEPYSDLINSTYYAVGIGNQCLFIIPKSNTVVVTTADNLLHPGKNVYSIFFEYILPSLEAKMNLGSIK
jgi:CubicO group peptidase (beta-lactamase class C family)